MKNDKLRDLILQLDQDELVDILMEYAKQEINFANQFYSVIEKKLTEGGEDEARKEVNNSFWQIVPTGSRYSRYDDTNWCGIMKDSLLLFNKASQALSMGNLHRAVAYPLEWLTCFCRNFTEEAFSYDHEGVEFSVACREAISIIEQIMTNPASDTNFKEKVSAELSSIAEKSTVFDDYCFVNLKAFAKRMKAMTQSNEDALANIEELLERQEFNVSLSDLIIQKSRILFAMNKKEDALSFLQNNVCEKEVCEHLVALLKDKQEYDRALFVLEKAIRLGESYHRIKWLEKEIEILELQGKHEEVTNTYRKLFIQTYGDINTYKELKKRIVPVEWKGYLSSLMNETIFDSYCFNRNNKAEILKEENDYQGLFDYMCTVNNHDKLDLYLAYASQLPLDYQIKFIPFYMDALREEAAAAKKRDHYQRVRNHMERFREINESEEAIKTLLAEFRELYRRRPSFMEELKRMDKKQL